MLIRYASAITAGTLVSLSLLYVMQALVSVQPGVVSDPRPRFELRWIRLADRQSPPLAEDRLPDREDLTQSPTPPGHERDGGDGIEIRFPPPGPGPVPGYEGAPGLAMVDGPLVALVRVEAAYPPPASTRGLEGYVVVQFDVLADGHVANVSVIESSHRVFERAAVAAAQRFIYKPRVANGEPQVTTGIRNLFRFRLDD